MKKLATAIAITALIGTPAFAADMALKVPPPAPAPVPTWTGFYGGIQFGGGWGDEAVNNNSGNDPVAVSLFNGAIFGNSPLLGAPRISQSGAVGGVEAGYNWQVGSTWLLGIETEFSGSGMSGTNSATAGFLGATASQMETVNQQTDWFGTVRGRAGWLATPNLLLFGTGGFAYGKVSDSVNWAGVAAPGEAFELGFLAPHLGSIALLEVRSRLITPALQEVRPR